MTRLQGKVRYDSQWIKATQDANGVTSKVYDRLTEQTIDVRSQYLIGCDGAKSPIAESLNLEFDRIPGGPEAVNVHIKMDLSDKMGGKESLLTWALQPGAEFLAIFRMIIPWTEWVVILLPSPK